MERTTISDTDAQDSSGYSLTDALGAEHLAANWYHLSPDEGLPGGLHAHADQEEVVLVVTGVAAFETLEGEVRVEAGEAIRFAPGEYQSGRNAGETELDVLALGAPRESDDVRVPATCPDCGADSLRLETDDRLTFGCPDCAAEHVPAPCRDCGSDALAFTTDEIGEPVVECGGCGARFDDVPLAE